MKKTISINIAGIVFHIEDDGYEKLNTYLKAIQKYFSSYEGSKEIVEDIEARIAEKFWNKQKLDDKQAISLQDVEGLIASMGSVSDFAAIEEDEDLALAREKNQSEYAFSGESKGGETFGKANQATSQSEENYSENKYNSTNKKLFRDTKRKLLGGVCAGLAYNLGFDPLWVRLAFLFLLLGIGPITAGVFSGITVLFYIACWIAFPANPALEEDDRIRKFYRNPDGKVLGGVMSGIASYTGWDLGMLRFVSVLSIFLFGSGIVVYAILWIIAPEAKTLTDKMQMSGEPITLENIESNIKRTFNVDEKTENTLSKLLLLPFRIISQVFKALSPFVEFLISAGRIFVGGIMAFTGVITIVASFFALFVSIAAVDNLPVYFFDIPLGLFGRDASSFMLIGGFLAFAVPLFVIAWAGISLVIRKNLFTPTIWQSALGVFVVGLLITMYTGVKYQRNFARESSVEKVLNFSIDGKTPIFAVNNNDYDFKWRPTIEVIGYDGTTIKVEQVFKSKGKDGKDADKNATDIDYKIVQTDSTITFDDRFELKETGRYRSQRLNLKVFIPFETEFVMTQNFSFNLENRPDDKYFDNFELVGNNSNYAKFKFTQNGELVCVNRTLKNENDSENNITTLDLKNFEFIKSQVEGGICNYEIHQGSEFQVEVEGFYNKKDLKYEIKNNTLFIQNSDNNALTFKITMPNLRGMTLKGGNGESHIYDISEDKLNIEIADENVLVISGSVVELSATGLGDSDLQAFDLQAINANINAKDNAKAHINVSKKMDVKTAGMAQVRYRGEPFENHTVSDGGTIEKE